MVTLVPETTTLSRVTGNSVTARRGLNHEMSVTTARPAAAPAGIALRRNRTYALWRRAPRIRRAKSRGPLAFQACVGDAAVLVTVVRAIPIPAGAPAPPRGRATRIVLGRAGKIA